MTSLLPLFTRSTRSARSTPFALALLAAVATGGAAAATAPVPVYAFAGGPSGNYPYAAPLPAADGWLYGITSYGVTSGTESYSGWGTVYRFDPASHVHETLHVFDGNTEGGSPQAGLIAGRDGAFYGTTAGGDPAGAAAGGSVYRITADGRLTTLHRFAATGDTGDGFQLTGALVQDAQGVLYGLAQRGGDGDQGTIFRLAPDGTGFQVLYRFAGADDGGTPVAGLSIDAAGRLVGTASQRGTHGYGTVFRLERDGTGFAVLHGFSGGATGDGSFPMSDLVGDAAGNWYGTTFGGGTAPCSCGTVFQLAPDGRTRVLRSLHGGDGSGPVSPVVFGPNGHLFGTAYMGGANLFYGSAFEISTDGRELGVVSFDASVSQLQAGLAWAPDGLLYGAGLGGGANGLGALFTLDPAAFSVKRPPAAPTVTLTALRTSVAPGQQARLSWNATNARRCEASGGWSGSRPTYGNAWVTPAPAGSATSVAYTLICTGPAGSASATATVTVQR